MKRQGIQLKQSEFLKDHYAYKRFGFTSYDPMDKFGYKMSHYWKKGSTTTSVSLAKIRNRIKTVFNPDTYTEESFTSLKKYVIR